MKKILLTFIALILSVATVSSLTGLQFAFAGSVTKDLIEEDFSSKKLDSAEWFTLDGNEGGISFDSSENPYLIVEEPKEGSTVTCTQPIMGQGVRISVDIDTLDFGDDATETGKGWFAFIYNMDSVNDGVFYSKVCDPSTKGSTEGIYFTYHESVDQLIFASMFGSTTQFVDGNGTPIEQRTQWNFYDASAITDVPTGAGNTKITNKTITVDFADNGVSVYVKTRGENGNGTLVIKSVGTSMPAIVPNTYALLAFCQGSQAISYVKIDDMQVTDIEESRTYAKFDDEHLSYYRIYNHPSSKTMFLGYGASLRLDSEFSNEYPLFVNRSITINEPDDEYSYWHADASINLKSIAADAKFGLLSGVRVRSLGRAGDDGTTFVYLTKESGVVKVGIETYYEKNVATEILQPTAFVSEDEYAEIAVNIDNKGKIDLKVNGTELYSTEEGTEREEGFAASYCGFALMGDNTGFEAEISQVKMDNRYYTRPQNADISTDFENDEYNTNDWYLYYSPYLGDWTNSAYVNDGEIVFQNLAMNSGLATQREFSDFEMQFDITDIRREVVYGDNNEKIYPVSSFVGVYFGAPTTYYNFGNIGVGGDVPIVYVQAPVDMDTWDREKDGSGNPRHTTVYVMGNGLNTSYELPELYDFWNPNYDGLNLQFKIKVVEEVLEVSFRIVDPKDDGNALPWTTRTFTMAKHVSGHISICTMGCNYYVPVISEGASCGYFKADNITVTNLDKDPGRVTYDMATSKKPKLGDAAYDDPYKAGGKYDSADYLINENQSSGGCSGSISATEIVTLLSFGAIILLVGLRRNKYEK